MRATITVGNTTFQADLSKPIVISSTIRNEYGNPNAYFLPSPKIFPFHTENFIGSVVKGGPVNCDELHLSPHGNGTHTECVGHISSEKVFIHECLKDSFCIARVLTIEPSFVGGDSIIELNQLTSHLKDFAGSGLVIRTLPNGDWKKNKAWSGSNPPFISEQLAIALRERGIRHLLIDVPSVDKEDDEGALLAHHAFWNYPNAIRMNATITEMIYVPNEVADGDYLLQFSILAVETDASPSQIFLYELLQD